jgi:Protein of unknown function (DUF4238)
VSVVAEQAFDSVEAVTILRPLPLGIQAILPGLAVDSGKTRAARMLAAYGAGVDSVERYVHEIDAALGAGSPGRDGLLALVRETRSATSPQTPTVENQHVVSQVVLRPFVEVLPPHGHRKLYRYDLGSGGVEPKGLREVGRVESFVRIDSLATERLWQQVEAELPAAIRAATAGKAHDDPKSARVLRDALALHYTRNPQTHDAHLRAFATAWKRELLKWTGTAPAREAFRRRYGFDAAGPQADRIGAEEPLSRVEGHFREGVLFRLRVEDLYEQFQAHFAGYGLEVLKPADPNDEFLIGDVPALTVNFGQDAVGVAQGVAFFDANTIFLPLGPRLAVALGPRDTSASIPHDQVDRLNAWQVRGARREVFLRPSATAIAARIPGWLTARAA